MTRFKILAIALVLAFAPAAFSSKAEAALPSGVGQTLEQYWTTISANWWTYGTGKQTGSRTYSSAGDPWSLGPYVVQQVTDLVYDWTISVTQVGNVLTITGSENVTSTSGIKYALTLEGLATAPISNTVTSGPGPGYPFAPQTYTVPGPVAGAGLPAVLALFGYGALRRRPRAA